MKHLIASGRPGETVFSTWAEARVLWDRIARAVPRIAALTLMPDHLHLLSPDVDEGSLGRVLQGYAHWRHARSGQRGSLFEPVWGEVLVKPDRIRTVRRYIEVNAVRGGLVDDPLEWPFGTHRDSLGLVTAPICAREHDVDAHRAWICEHPAVRVERLALPAGVCAPDHGWRVTPVRDAVSAVTRTPLDQLRRRGPPRTLLLRSLCQLTDRSLRDIAEQVGVHRGSVWRVGRQPDARLRLVARVLGDPRLSALDGRERHDDRRWRDYLTRAEQKRRCARWVRGRLRLPRQAASRG